jgi:anti-anti-sigma factor
MEILNAGKNGEWLIIYVKGRIDAVTAPEFESKLTNWINEGEINLIVDVGGLEYISSAGLRSILGTAKRLKSKSGNFVVSSLRDMVKEAFDISGFSTIIPISDTVESVLDGKNNLTG